MKNLIFRFSGLLAVGLLFVGKITTMCIFSHYQVEVPETLRK